MIGMGRFDKGVTSYTFASVEIQIAFPEDETKCKWCKFLRHYDGIDRDKCLLTDEILFSREIRGYNCPLIILNTVKAEEMDK